MSSQRGRLFDAPFLHQSSSSSSYVESIPLRRRENDSFSSPSRYPRRRRRDQQWLVKTVMKAVLFSPVLVLFVWGVVTVIFSQRTNQPMGQRRGGQWSKQHSKKAKHHNSGWIPRRGVAIGESNLLVPAQGNSPIIQPQLRKEQREILQPPPQQAQFYYSFPESDGGQKMVSQPAKQTPLLRMAASDSQIHPQQVIQPFATQQHSQHESQVYQKQDTVRYLYYDPQTLASDQQGNLYLPKTVYDAYGQPVVLQSLSARTVLMEPPPPTLRFHNVSTSTNVTSNFTHPQTVKTPVHDQRKGLAIQTVSDWGTTHAGDSSMIVCTVGVMALLVGALSARRLRSKSVLSSCIENEALEDDAAYDAAYTMRYNTFQQGFNGDLEKFDV